MGSETGTEPVAIIAFLNLNSVPKKLVVIGAGYIGLEMGSVWLRLGSEVQVVEYLDYITPGMDREVSDAFSNPI